MSDKEEPKPALRLVAENDRRELDRNIAMRDVEYALRQLAANIIRVVRGAGKSYEIPEQCVDVLNAVHRYREQAGVWPSAWELDEALSVRRDLSVYRDDEDWNHEAAYDSVMRGSLQVAASRLVGQLMQERRGESEMSDAVRSLIRIRDEAQKRRQEAEREYRRATSGKGKKRPKGRDEIIDL